MVPFTLSTEITNEIKEYILINNQDNNKCLASTAYWILRYGNFFAGGGGKFKHLTSLSEINFQKQEKQQSK
jgi:hypothetical protein